MTADKILDAAAETFRERNAMYRENWKDVGAALAAFFPEGIRLKTPEEYTRFHFFILMTIKLSRYANMFETGHQDSMRDLAVYAAMLESFDASLQTLSAEDLKKTMPAPKGAICGVCGSKRHDTLDHLVSKPL